MSAIKLEPSGLGGWLILPALHLITSIGFTVYNLFVAFTPDSINGLKMIFAEGSDLASLRLPIITSLVLGSIFLPFVIYCAYNFFTKKPKTRNLMIVFYCLLLFVAVVEFFLAQPMQAVLNDDTASIAFKELIRASIFCVIWVPYFLVSVRVQNTFNPDTSEMIGQVFD